MILAYFPDGKCNLDYVIFFKKTGLYILNLRLFLGAFFYYEIFKTTKEQFEELHKEFIDFLATQSITAEEWKEIKIENIELTKQQLDIYSDLLLDGVFYKS